MVLNEEEAPYAAATPEDNNMQKMAGHVLGWLVVRLWARVEFNDSSGQPGSERGILAPYLSVFHKILNEIGIRMVVAFYFVFFGPRVKLLLVLEVVEGAGNDFSFRACFKGQPKQMEMVWM